MKDLRIDLILDAEKRSASPISFKFILRLSGAVIGILLLLFGSVFVVRVKNAERRLKGVNEEWASIEPRLKKANDFDKDRAFYEAVLSEIEGWHNSRMPWSEYMLALQTIVPEDIQITTLTMNDQVLRVDGFSAWVSIMSLDGKAWGEAPKDDVDWLVRELNKDEKMSVWVKNASVDRGSFKQDPTSKARHHRVFEVTANLHPRKFLSGAELKKEQKKADKGKKKT